MDNVGQLVSKNKIKPRSDAGIQYRVAGSQYRGASFFLLASQKTRTPEYPALQNLNMKVEKREFFVLLGTVV